ncbi:Diamine N-acetyltransferase [Flagellimonas maritima]|uniref:Diamine N-acetyltransferase n=1 Tax=Flagellimonas maritima TaxID=1383885 RepID=A0A2Z4LR44_9FLAO|nr:GNAT family N-acetyltransferase [Allomuricauda aurantiaca]AWX44361.1 Diamine N-acetyltransferase [Allomuricauda aurantiaca]
MKIVPKIRFARPADIETIIDLCEAHAIYEQTGFSRNSKDFKLGNDLFGNKQRLYCLVVESKKQLIGYATYMKQYSTWEACDYIYMDCLFLKDFARGLGIGKKLIARIKLEAEKMKCKEIQWQTPDFNYGAIKFYNQLGATSKKKERFYMTVASVSSK